MTGLLERRLLQLVVCLGAVVPVAGGLWGAAGGLHAASAAAESQTRYLSGLLLGVGVAFWACVPVIERRGPAVRLLGAIVMVGGVTRLIGGLQTGFGAPIVQPLIMELGVTPLLLLWRERVERRAAAEPTRGPTKS